MLRFIFVTFLGFLSLGRGAYVLQDDYTMESFFTMFDFFTDDDPTHGYVNYVDQSTAERQGLIGQRDGATYMGVDHTDVAHGRGRDSVRLSSKKAYNHGLFVLDLKHMPGGQCGSWPAFWMLGPSWPAGGEIDIIEGANSQESNDMTLHTSSGCTVSNDGAFSGEMRTTDCDVNAPGQSPNYGCKIASHGRPNYGQAFNRNGGGVYATEWSSDGISVWFFPRDTIPDDLSESDPDPRGWGKPDAKFGGGCDIDKSFQDHQLIFDITFCGDWAGSVWELDSICSSQAPSCQEYVQNSPNAFEDLHWQINSLRVYQSDGSADQETMVIEPGEIDPVAPSEALSESTPGAAKMAPVLQDVRPVKDPAPAPTPAPEASTLAISVQKPKHKTISAMQLAHFGSSNRIQLKDKRHRHGHSLATHQHKDHV